MSEPDKVGGRFAGLNLARQLVSDNNNEVSFYCTSANWFDLFNFAG